MSPHIVCFGERIVTLFAFKLSPLWVFKCLFRLPAREDAKSHWLHFFTFLHCAFLNGLPKRMQSRIGCICLAFLLSACSNASSKRLHKKLHNHIDCICLTYLHCVFANVSSYVGMQSHNGCNYLTSLFCAFSNVSSNCLQEMKQIHINCICLTFTQFAFSNGLPEKMHSHTGFICLTFLQCLFSKWALKLHIWEDASHTSYNHCICLHSLHCHTVVAFVFPFFYRVFSNDSSNHLFD